MPYINDARLIRAARARMRSLLLACGMGCAVLSACAPPVPAAGGTGGAAVVNDASADADAPGDLPASDGATVNADVPPAESTVEALCPETPVPRRKAGSLLEVQTEFVFGGKTMQFGEPNDVGGGMSVIPTNVRFYVSEVALVQASGAMVPVDLVTPDRIPVAFGVQLLIAEDPDAMTLRLLAPPGEYQGLVFTWGLTDACNSGSAMRHAPLWENSQMTWPHEVGYLFFRFDSQVRTPSDSPAPPPDGGAPDGGTSDAGALDGGAPKTVVTSIHMGGHVGTRFAPVIRVGGALSVPSTGTLTRHLRINMNEVYKGALTETDLTNFDGFMEPGVLSGERLRRALPNLSVFTLAP